MRTLIACAIVLIVVHRCLAGSIGLYSDTAGSNCTLTIDQGQTGVAYALGRTSAADPDDGYITNCEFRIIGLPSGWLATALPDAAISIAVGDPLGDGTNLYWDVPPHGLIPLFTIYITAMTQESNVELQVVKHVDPVRRHSDPPSRAHGFDTRARLHATLLASASRV